MNNVSRLTNGQATVTRRETCNGRPAHWDMTFGGTLYCSECGKTPEHTSHQYDYSYDDPQHLGVTDRTGEWREIEARVAYGYLSGELELKTIASIMGMQAPYTLEAHTPQTV